MASINDLHTSLSQAERTADARKDDLEKARYHEEEVRADCGYDEYDKDWSKARNATQRAYHKYERALREAEKLRRIIRDRNLNGERQPRPSAFSDADPFMRQGATAPPKTQRQQTLPFKDAITQWREQCIKCFADYSAIEVFPTLPVRRPCIKQACGAETRALSACKCQIQHAFSSVADLDLKTERTKWHPDKFSACGSKRDDFQNKAKEIFIVVDAMYRQA